MSRFNLFRHVTILSALICFVVNGWGQTVTLTATGGTATGTFTTLKGAFDAINLGTHTGAIVISINANTTEGTTPATLNSSGAGSASYTSILINPTNDAVSVSGNPATGFGVIQLKGADNVTIDGDNPNTSGTNRNLTINNTNTATAIANSCIRIATAATNVTSADNIIIRNCNLNGNVTSGNSSASATSGSTGASSSSNSSFGIYCGGNGGSTAIDAPTAITSVTSQTAPSGTTINNLVITNNAINQCARAIVFNGAASTVSTGVTISNNLIGASATLTGAPPYSSPATTVYTKGIWINGTNAITISGNTLRNIMSFVSTPILAIELAGAIGSGTISITSNTINGVYQNGNYSSKYGAILVSSAGGPFSVTNNTISNIDGFNTTTTSGSAGGVGIDVSTAATSALISGNNITKVYNRGNGYAARGIVLNGGNIVTVQNNYISDILNVGNTSFSLAYGAFGILVNGGTGHKIYHNSVNLFGTNTGTGSNLTACFGILATSQTGIDVRNNIFSNTMTSSASSNANVCIYLPSGGTSSMNLTLNNNAYYTGTTSGVNGICHAGTTYTNPNTATAGLWTAANFSSSVTTPSTNLRSYTSVLSSAGTNDNASFAATSAVPFTSSTNLKINTSASGVSSLFLTGASGTGVTTDIENDTRATNPCIGADEFALPVSCTTPTSPIDGATNVSLTTSFTWAAATNATSYDVYLGTDNPPTNVVNGTNFTSATFTPANALAGSTTYYWRIVPKNAGSTASGCSVWSFTTQAATPTITASNLGTFSDRCINTTSTANSFNISGIYLTTDDITVGPLTGFAFSTTSNGSYTSTLTISQPGGTLSSTPIFVQFTPTAVGSFNGNIPITGGGLSAALNVSAVGTGINTPATSSTGISSALTSTSVTLAGSYVANCQTISAYGIEYSTTSGFANGSGTSVTSSNQSAGSYTLDLSSLNPGTTYFYKSYATYGSTTVWGTQSSFTTTALEFTSAATGAWNSTSTWTGGIVPVCGSNVTIQAGHNVTVNSSSNVSRNLTIASGGTLTVASGDLTVGCNLNNTPLTNNGTLTVSGGILNVNGNVVCASTFNQSGGTINIDGNNGGNTTGSVAAGTAMLSITSSTLNLTGGTIVIIDPNAGSSGFAFNYNNGSHYNMPSGSTHTIQFGNGVSTDATAFSSGFRHSTYTGSGRFMFQNLVINLAGTGNRNILTNSWSHGINGNLTITNGDYQTSSALTLAGNLTNDGTFSATSTLTLGTFVGGTVAASTNAQTISGSGTFRNLTSSPTASLTNLTVNNSNSTGVTISAPLSISGTLTMTAGKINTTATNLLTLGTTTAAGTLAYTAGQIAGPFARTFAASSSTTAVYDLTTLFPVGDGTNYIPIHIDPINAGVVQMRGQAFNSNTGTAGTGVASVLSTDRWEALVTSGTITDCFIGLNDAQIASGNLIAQSSSSNGTYNAVSGVSTFVSGTPNALRTATAIPNASYSGYFTYAAPGPVISSFTPASVCPGTVGTITITGTNLASATSVTLNGEACTITANTATSITITTDATPQAGNIVVTTAANSATSAAALSLFTLPTVTASSNASNNTVCSGTAVILNGGGATSYVWNNGVSNNTSFTPTSTSTYTVTGTDVNACVNTANITITVNNAVSISGQPINEVVLPNANATFSVTSSGTGLTYQWELSTDSGSSWNAISNGGIYTGATTNTLTLTGVTTETGNQYRCVVSGTAPCGPVTSSVATLTISSTAISAQPTNQSICESSGSASFSVTTTGNAPSSIQWQVSTDGGSNWSNLTGETNTTLSLTGLTTSSNGYQYQCVINGNVTSNAATLTVSVPSVAGSVSADQGICSGATPSSITLTGNTGTIQWQSSTDNSTFSNISGATSSTLAASTIGALNSTRYYRATVTNGGCSAATSAVVTVTVTPAPNAGTLSGTQTICANATTTFTSNGDTGGAWTSANTAIATANISSGVVTGVAAGTTTITYTITGTGGCSNATETRTLTVNAVPPITSATATPATICAGGTVTLSAASITASSGTAVIGSGNTQGANNTTFVRVGNTVGNQFKNQYLFTAAELNAAGLTSGNITSLAFDVFVSGGGTVSNLTFKLGTTTLTSLTSSYVTGLTEVYTIATYPTSGVLQVGVQTVNFTTPFNWNGTSNLVLEACSQLASMGTAGDLRSSTTTFVSTITNSPSTTACGSSTGAGTVSVRPNFTFGGQVGTNNAANFSWSWNSTPTVSAATGTTTAVNNTTSAINQGYTVTATNATTGCASTATTSTVTINPLPAAPTANNSTQCGVGIPTATIVSNTGASTPNINWYTNIGATTLAPLTYSGGLVNYYSNSFGSTTITPATISGSASVTGGILQLTPNTASQLGAITIPSSGVNANKYRVSFDLYTSNSAQNGADGLSYSFGDDISTVTYNGEVGSGTKLKVSFDTYGTTANTNDLAGIRIIYGSSSSTPGQTVGTSGVLAFSPDVTWTNGTYPVIVDINESGILTLTVNGSVIFSNIQLPSTFLSDNKATWTHAIRARTGGVPMIQGIDNLVIQQSAGALTIPNSISTTTTYYVTESSGGCTSTATPVTITVNTPPTITASASSASICAGQSTTLSASSSNSGYTYSWNNNGGSGASVTVSPSATTTYTVTGTDASGGASNGCSTTAAATVTVNPLPTTPTITPSTATLCSGVSPAQSLVAGASFSPSQYTLSTATATYTAITGTSVSSIQGDDYGVGSLPIGFAFPYNGTTFTQFGVSSNGFIELGSTSTYTSNASSGWFPSSNALVSRANIIAPLWDDNNTTGGTVIYTTSGVSPNMVLTVQWTGLHVGGSGSSTNPTIDMQLILNENGSISFKYGAQSSALTSTSASIGFSGIVGNYLSVTPLSPLSSSSTSSTAENTTANTGNIPNGTVLNFSGPSAVWTSSTGLYTNAAASTPYSGTSATIIYALPTSTTTYTLTATSAAGCTASSTATITVSPTSVAGSVSAASSTFCAGTGTTLTLTGNTGTIQWQNSSDNITFANMSGETASTLNTGNLTQTTYYKAVVTSGACTAANTNTQTITVSPTTVAGTISAASSSVCTGTGTTLTLSGNTGTIQWQNSSDNVTFANISGETASSLSTGNLTQTSYYKAVVTSGVCTAANTSTQTITVNQPTLIWTGATSTDPTVTTNWNPAALPCPVADITVPGGLTNYPIYTSNLTISSGGSYTLQAGAQLTVNGTLTNNGTFTLQDGATFVQGTGSTSIAGTGTYNVEKALADNSSNWTTTSGRFWYMGVPMVSVARSSFGTSGTTTNRLWSYTEATKQYTPLDDNGTLLSAGTGYVHRRSTDGTLTFSATGTNGLYGSDFTATNLTKTAGYTSGVHLVSNPYMAYLDWNALTKTNIDSTFYIRSNNTTSNDISALISYNSSTNLYTNTSSVSITNASQIRYIAPMQSIWVRVGAAASTGSLGMTRSMLSHQTGNGLKSSTVFPALAKVNLVDGNRFDQLLVYMNGDMTNEVDQYDSEKLPVSGTVQVYTMASNKKLVMNGLKNNKKKVSVPLYLELPASKSYTLNLADYVLDNGLILLEDKLEGTMQDFTLLGNYTFYANSGLLQNRFVLHFILPDAEFTNQGPSNSWVGPETSYTDGGNVQITNDDRGNIQITVDQPEDQKVEGNVSVTDMNGKEIYKGQLDGITTAVELNVPAGIYYLTVQSGVLFEKKKVFIQD